MGMELIGMQKTYSQAIKANMRKLEEIGRPFGPYGAGFSDFLMMKVLARKRVERFGNPFGANALPMVFSQKKELVRNVCVRVDPIRLAELDALMELLGCNKQEFVLELLVAGIEQAKAALRDAGLEPAFDEAVDKRMAEAGFTAEPSHHDGFWTLHHRGELVVNEEAARHKAAAEAMSVMVEKAVGEAGEGNSD